MPEYLIEPVAKPATYTRNRWNPKARDHISVYDPSKHRFHPLAACILVISLRAQATLCFTVERDIPYRDAP